MALIKPLVVNRKGEVWSPQGLEGYADSKQFLNSLGPEQAITTLTSILPGIIEQKFYIPGAGPADFVPIEVGQGNPFATELLNWSTGITGGDFESGFVNMSSNESGTNSDNIQIEPIKRTVASWKKNVNYNILQEGVFNAATGNMDYISALYSARKKEYDLGFQKTIFFGSKSKADIKGLLTMVGVNSNTALITKTLSSMTAAELNAVIAGLMPAYLANCAFTSVPNTFVIPAVDFYGLTSQMSETYPLRTKLSVLLEALQQSTGNSSFEIKPLAYADKVRNATVTGLNKNRYVLYNKAPDSVICNVPLDFTVTLPGTANGFDYESAAYSRFTGVQALRPLEALYFDWA